jgi:hypothetical protein
MVNSRPLAPLLGPSNHSRPTVIRVPALRVGYPANKTLAALQVITEHPINSGRKRSGQR